MRATSGHSADWFARIRGALVAGTALLLSLSTPECARAFEIGATQCVASACLNERFNASPIHQEITREGLKDVAFSASSGPITFKEKQLLEIIDANAFVDAVQIDPRYHFDACSNRALLGIMVNDCLQSSSQRLIAGKNGLVARLSQRPTITAEHARQLRVAFGSFLHSLQDFYSHTNWINIHPGITARLGDMDVVRDQPADTLPCPVSPLLYPSASYLTSGWAILGLSVPYESAPIGQCAHGAPARLGVGGMHKDAPDRPLYNEARRAAIEDTTNFAKAVLLAPTNLADNVCMFMTDSACEEKLVTFGLGADDYGVLIIDGKSICTYDDISRAGGCVGTFRMKPGTWYNIFIDYKNRAGSNGLSLTWDQPGPRIFGYGFAGSGNLVPLANLRTQQGTGYVSGLRGDYFSLSGNLESFRIGEGPIDAVNNVYNSRIVGSWNGYGYFSLFGERLTGQIRLDQ